MTFLVPRVSQLFDRLSQEELHHKNLIELVRSYQSQAEENFRSRRVRTDIPERPRNSDDPQRAHQQYPSRPPFLDILEDVLDFEKSIEGRHYTVTWKSRKKSIKETAASTEPVRQRTYPGHFRRPQHIRESLKEQSKQS
jgi:hypothetical protein